MEDLEKGTTVISVIGFLVAALVFSGIAWFCNAKTSVMKAESTVEAFEEYRAQYGDNYILEPDTNSNYEKAKEELKYFEKIGFYKPKAKKETTETNATQDKIVYNNLIEVITPSGKKWLKDNNNKYLFWEIQVNGEMKKIDFSEVLQEFGDKGTVKGKSGYLYDEKFWVATSPGNYVEFEPY